MFNCVFVTFPCGVLCQVWYLIVSIADLCQLSYFNDIPADEHFTGISTRTRAHNYHKFGHIPAQLTTTKTSFLPKSVRLQILSGPLWGGSRFGTLQTEALQSNDLILFRTDLCKEVLVISLCYAGGDFVGSGISYVAGLDLN